MATSAEPKPGWTRYWCYRCRRGLRADGQHQDTVTPVDGEDHWTHDQCGGQVSLSSREGAT